MNDSILTPSSRFTHFINQEKRLVSNFLKSELNLHNESIDFLLKIGAIYKNKIRIHKDEWLLPNDYLRVHLRPKRFDAVKRDWSNQIIKVTPEFIAVEKPKNVPVHATLDNSVENLLFQIQKAEFPEAIITHRLDQPTSGVVILARTQNFQSYFNEQIRSGDVKKYYSTYTIGPLPIGKLIHYMKPNLRSPKEISEYPNSSWKRCELEILSSYKTQNHYYSKIQLITGRTHQIRAQLSYIGQPIIGDTLYGSKISSDLQLHCDEICFNLLNPNRCVRIQSGVDNPPYKVERI